MKDGWYNTGRHRNDRTKNGFVRITDRLSRFSKIGGEMVPHTSRLKRNCRNWPPATEHGVCSQPRFPDERTGEKINCAAYVGHEPLKEVLGDSPRCILPALWKRGGAIQPIEAMPSSATGKTRSAPREEEGVGRGGNLLKRFECAKIDFLRPRQRNG